jgi:hypothetical protein
VLCAATVAKESEDNYKGTERKAYDIFNHKKEQVNQR